MDKKPLFEESEKNPRGKNISDEEII